MHIRSPKIPMKFTNLPILAEFLNSSDGQDLLTEVRSQLAKSSRKPNNSNATFAQISDEIGKVASGLIWFEFYSSLNIFVGHNVISYAHRGHTVLYNTRFHSLEEFTLADWIENFFHELTHLADQESHLTFGHKSQKDKLAAPFIVGAIAKAIFLEKYEKKGA